MEGDNGEAGAAVLPIEAVHAQNDSGPPAAGSSVAVEAVGVSNAIMPSIEKISAARVPSVERVHSALSSVVSPQEDGGVGADGPPVEAVEARRGSEPPAVHFLAGTEAANAVMPSLEIAAGEPSVERVHLSPPRRRGIPRGGSG